MSGSLCVQYVVYTKSSLWLDNLWSMASQLFCESILFSAELKVNGFAAPSDTDLDAEYERLESGIPDMIHDKNTQSVFLNLLNFRKPRIFGRESVRRSLASFSSFLSGYFPQMTELSEQC